jgi:predicted dehydrogenase
MIIAKNQSKVRYAVVGVGWIAQEDVIPSFTHAENSQLVALISSDPKKHQELGKKYGVKTYTYEEYDDCLKSGEIDAVYIALPNHLHREYTVKAANAGDQFAAEIIYFSDCLLHDKDPEPSGEEGLADIRIIRAINQSAQTGMPVQLGEFKRQHRPGLQQVIQIPASEPPKLIHAADPSGKS